jgi:phosphoribosylformimino-5-aminoimidazole carboxamide ribonucleotide (ProFAR) isomerase
VTESEVLRKIFEPVGKKVSGGGGILRNEERYNLYLSLNIMKVVISKRMRWAGHAVQVGQVRNA